MYRQPFEQKNDFLDIFAHIKIFKPKQTKALRQNGWGALAADGDTVIASKAYVDAMDATKQDASDRYEGAWNAATSAQKSSTDLYPSMHTLEDLSSSISSDAWDDNALNSTAQTTANKAKLMKVEALQDTAQRAQDVADSSVTAWSTSSGDGASNDTLPTTKAVTQQIVKAKADLNLNIQQIEDLFEDGMDTRDDKTLAAYQAWVTDGRHIDSTNTKYTALMAAIAEDARYHNVVADDAVADQNLIPRNSDITKGIAYAAGTGIQHHQTGLDITQASAIEAANKAWGDLKTAKTTDDYVPTVAAVEARVQKAYDDAVTQAGSNIDKETSNVLSSSQTAYLPTVASVQAAKDTTEVANESGGQITITAGANTDDNHVPTSLTVKNDMDTLKTAINKKLNANTAITASTSNSVVTYDTNGLVTGGVSLDETLRGVNAEAASSTLCTAANPCVLTYLGGTGANAKYRWTNMDTEGVAAANIN